MAKCQYWAKATLALIVAVGWCAGMVARGNIPDLWDDGDGGGAHTSSSFVNAEGVVYYCRGGQWGFGMLRQLSQISNT